MAYFKHDEMYQQGLKQFNDNPRRQFTWQELNEMIRKPNIPALAKEPPKKDSVCSLWISWGTLDKSGKVKELETKQSESFVANFLRAINAFSTNQSIVPVSGATYTAGSPYTGIYGLAAQSNATYGIVVGRSGNSVFISQTALSQQVLNGTTSGLIQHGAMSWSSTQVNAPSATLQGNRVFTNGAVSGPLSILEAGLYIDLPNNGNSFRVPMIVRDVTNQTIASGVSNTAQYTFKVTA